MACVPAVLLHRAKDRPCSLVNNGRSRIELKSGIADTKGIVAWLESRRNRTNLKRYGSLRVQPRIAYGVSIRLLRRLARSIGSDHCLARELWRTQIHEARILASVIDVP